MQSHGPHTVGGYYDKEDWFRICLHGRDRYTIKADGKGDTVGELYNSAGTTLVASDDDSGTDLMFSISYVPPVSDYYLLKVRSYSSTPGTYTLTYTASYPLLDERDPADNTRAGAVLLPEPGLTGQTTPWHSLGNVDDPEDWYKVFLLLECPPKTEPE